MIIRFLFFICILHCSFISSAQISTVEVTDNSRKSIERDILFLLDTSQNLSEHQIVDRIIKEGKKYPVKGRSVFFEKTDAYIWGYFTIRNTSGAPTTQLFKIDNYFLNFVNVYEVDSGEIRKIGQSGDHIRLKDRNILHRDHLFEIKLYPHEEKAILFNVQRESGNNVIGFELIDVKRFIEIDSNNFLLLGFLFGTLFLFSLYGFGVFFATRKMVYLYYALYAMINGISISNRYGLGFRYLYPNAVEAFDYITVFVAFAAAFFFVLFSIQFLEIKLHRPKWYKFLKGYLISYLIIASILFPLYYLKVKLPYLAIHYFLLLVVVALMITSAVLCWKRNSQASFYYLMSFSPIILSVPIIALLASGYLPLNLFTKYALLVSVALECLIISIGITLRLREEAKEKLRLSLQVADHERQLSQKLIEGGDKEKRRIALVLHDTIGVKLRYLKTLIDSNKIDNASGEVDILAAEIRDLSHSMAPTVLDFLAVPEAIGDIADKLNTPSFHIKVSNLGFPEIIDKKVKVTIYNCLNELINNTLKHSNATSVHIQFNADDNQSVISIEDNGHGLQDDSSIGVGLSNVQSRIKNINGSFTMESASGKGVICIIELPLS